ncbi:MAG: MCE family protein [Saprospirales bacterium]|nr:MCE family protein [Saprospirales bacterium]
MNTHTQNFKVRLGLFVIIGLAIFVFAIFIIGKQKHLFDPVFKVTSTFYNVSGLQVGNNVRFSGINVGTVDNIAIINDSTVRVDLLIKQSVKKFIRQDCGVAIGSEGLIGDRLVIVTQGSGDSPMVKNGQELESVEPIETDAIMASLRVTAGYAEVVTEQLAEIMVKINSGSGTLGRLIQDTTIAQNLDQTMLNLRRSSKGLDENMQAAKDNILLRGHFKKKEKEAEKIKKEAEEKKLEEEKQ